MQQAFYPLMFKRDGMTQAYLWGGDKLRSLVPNYPASEPLSELWAVSDRPEDERVSVIANGPLTGITLRELMETRSQDLLGDAKPVDSKFPLLVKFLDAKERLSLQVHPPREVAQKLGGEPKTECWYFLAETEPTAQVIAGIKSGVTRETFESSLNTNSLEPLLHANPVRAGDCMFLPSGRLHAIDAGCLLLEIQQNSNTTYRVYDWGRIDKKTGQARALHVQEALASIDFADVTPSLQTKKEVVGESGLNTQLVDCPFFTLERWQTTNTTTHAPDRSFEIIVTLTPMELRSEGMKLSLAPLEVVLIPASVPQFVMSAGNYLRSFIRP